jgi:hypothetical protein
VSILSGYCVLSPASVQRAFHSTDVSQSRFYVVDCTQNIPSNTYAWAVSLNRGNPSILALIYYDGYDSDFRWKRMHYRHKGPADSIKLLEKLKNGARLIVNDESHDFEAGGKRDMDPMEEVGIMIPKAMRLRAALKVVHRVLRNLKFE